MKYSNDQLEYCWNIHLDKSLCWFNRCIHLIMHKNGSDEYTRKKNIHSRKSKFCISILINIGRHESCSNTKIFIWFCFSIHSHFSHSQKRSKKKSYKSVNKFMKMFSEFLDWLLFEIHLTGSQMNEMLHDTQIRMNEYFFNHDIPFCDLRWDFFSVVSFFSVQLDKYRFFNFEKNWGTRRRRQKKK